MFKNFHPAANLIYFISAFAAVSLADSILFYTAALLILIIFNIILDNARRLKSYLVFFIIAAAAIFILHPLANPRGRIILFYVFGGNPVTLESVITGLETALSLMCVFIIFTAFNLIINQDKFLYLFSKFAKQTALVIMLSVRFVPVLRRRIGEISQVSHLSKTKSANLAKSLKNKLKNGMNIILTLLTWSLEDAVITAQSMRARGYGLTSKRAFYFIYKFKARDFLFICFNTALFTAFMIYKNIIFFIFILALPVLIEIINYFKWRIYDACNRV